MRTVRFRRGLVFMGVTLAAAACTSTPASRTPAKSITAPGWEGKVDGVALAAAHADFDPHPQQIRVFKTNLKSAMRAMERPTTLVQLAPADPAYLAIVTGHQSNIGTYRDGHWVGARVQLVLVISAADKLASYWSSGVYSKTKLTLAGLGAALELPTSLPRVPVIPDIFGVERLGFDGFPVVGKNERTITVLTVQQCGGPSRLEASPYLGRVLLVITAPNGAPDQACPADLVILSVSTTLSEPLGARVLANGISGKTVPYFDDRSFATITVMPRDYRCGTGEPGAFELKGSGVGATVDCSGPATDSAPLAIEQEQGAAAETGGAWPVVGYPTVAGHRATLRVAASSGQVYARSLDWSAGGDSFAVLSLQEMEGQHILSSGELLAVARGMHLPTAAADTTVAPRRGAPSGGMAMFALPYLVGSTRSRALSNIYVQNLSVYWTSDPSSSKPSGTILSEVVGWNPGPPVPGSVGPVSEDDQPIVTVGSELGLTVAGGPRNVEVPNVLGLGEDAALQQMTQRGLLPKPQDGCMASSAENAVVAESPAAGAAVEPGSVITLVVNDAC